MSTLKKFVNRNIRLVRTLKYFWKYQKPNVEVIEHADWAIPR